MKSSAYIVVVLVLGFMALTVLVVYRMWSGGEISSLTPQELLVVIAVIAILVWENSSISGTTGFSSSGTGIISLTEGRTFIPELKMTSRISRRLLLSVAMVLR